MTLNYSVIQSASNTTRPDIMLIHTKRPRLRNHLYRSLRWSITDSRRHYGIHPRSKLYNMIEYTPGSKRFHAKTLDSSPYLHFPKQTQIPSPASNLITLSNPSHVLPHVHKLPHLVPRTGRRRVWNWDIWSIITR